MQTEDQVQALLADDEAHQQQVSDQLASALNGLRQAVSAWDCRMGW